MKRRTETAEERETRQVIEEAAWACTMGAGNDSEVIKYDHLVYMLGREPTDDERHVFDDAWKDNLRQMANP